MKSVGGAMLGVLKDHSIWVTSVAILNDPKKQLCNSGLCVVSGSKDDTVRIWDATGSEGKDGCLRVLKGHSHWVKSVAILNDSKKQLCKSGLCVVSGSDDKTVRIWDATGREGKDGCLRVFEGHSSGVMSVAILNDPEKQLCKSGLCVVSGSSDKTVRIWDATGREEKDGCLRVFKGHSKWVNSVAILNDPKKQLCNSGLCVVSGSDDDTVRIWDATGSEEKDGCLRVFEGHSSSIMSVAILNDPKKQLCKSGLCVVSGSDDKTLRIWDATGSEGRGGCLRVFQGHLHWVRSVAILNDPKKQLCKSGLCVVSGSDDNTVRIWDATGREGKDGCLRVLKGHSDFVRSVAILNDPKKQLCNSELCAVSGSSDKTVRIWDATGSEAKDGCLRVSKEHSSIVTSVVILNDQEKQLCKSGLCVVSGSVDNTVRICDAIGSKGKDGCLRVLKGHSNEVMSVAILNDPMKQLCKSGLCVVSGSHDSTIRICDAIGSEEKDGCLRVFKGHSETVWSVAILNDLKKQLCRSGLCVVSGSSDRTVRIWDATGREGMDGCLRVFKGHSEPVLSVAILNDPKRQLCKSGLCVVSGSYDKTVRIWDATGREKGMNGWYGCLRVFEGHSESVNSVAILNDSKKQLCKSGLCVVSGSVDKTVRIWDATGSEGKDGCLRVFEGHLDPVTSVVILNDPKKQLCKSGLCVVSGSWDKTVRIWDTVKSTCLYVNTFDSWILSIHVFPVPKSIQTHYFDTKTSSAMDHNRQSLHCIALGLKSGAIRVMYV
jgi:WD40 repeat protein